MIQRLSHTLLPLSLAAAIVAGCASTKPSGGTTTSTVEQTTTTVDPNSCAQNSFLSYARANTEPFTSGFKLDLGTISRVVAVKQGESNIAIVFMNGDFDPKRVAEQVRTPINETHPGKFAVVVTLTNGGAPIAPGTYLATSGYNKPFKAEADIEVPVGSTGTVCGVSANAGEVRVVKMEGGKICGVAALLGDNSGVTGTFVADIIE